jgi:hypothetical protein
MFDVDAKEMKGKNNNFGRSCYYTLRAPGWMSRNLRSSSGNSFYKKKHFSFYSGRKLCSHWPECNKSNDGNSTTILWQSWNLMIFLGLNLF